MTDMPRLEKNDRVALICPGCTCTNTQHPQLTADYLKKYYQLQPIFSSDTFENTSPTKRAEIFLEYLLNDEIKLIAILRGGEGSADILPHLHQYYEKIKTLKPKWLLGFSDFTALLVYFAKYYHWPVIHGPSPIQFATQQIDQSSEKATMDLLFGTSLANFDNVLPLNEAAKKPHIIEAELTGGNLSVINISIKDIWEMDTKDKIIFLEDTGEKAHKIIRTLKYFSRIGVFESAKAVIFGDFTYAPIGCQKDEQEHNRQAILKTLSNFAAHHDLPILYTPNFGHGKTNLPLVYATQYQLKLGKEAQLTLSGKP